MPAKSIAIASMACALLVTGCSSGTHRAALSPSSPSAAPSTLPAGKHSFSTVQHTYPVTPQSLNPNTPAQITGIEDSSQAPFSHSDFAVSNQYHDSYQNGWVSAFAGGKTTTNSDNSLSFGPAGVRIYTGSDSEHLQYVGQFLIPGTTGGAEIVAADGKSLLLKVADAAKGIQEGSYRFNLITHVFTPA